MTNISDWFNNKIKIKDEDQNISKNLVILDKTHLNNTDDTFSKNFKIFGCESFSFSNKLKINESNIKQNDTVIKNNIIHNHDAIILKLKQQLISIADFKTKYDTLKLISMNLDDLIFEFDIKQKYSLFNNIIDKLKYQLTLIESENNLLKNINLFKNLFGNLKLNKLTIDDLFKEAKQKIKTSITKYNKNTEKNNTILKTHISSINLDNKQKKIIQSWIDECINLYNTCVDLYNNDTNIHVNDSEVSFKNCVSNNKIIKKHVFSVKYNGEKKPAPYDMLSDVIFEFCANVSANITKIKTKQIQKFTMKKKEKTQLNQISICIPIKAISEKGLFPRLLKSFKLYKIKNNKKIKINKFFHGINIKTDKLLGTIITLKNNKKIMSDAKLIYNYKTKNYFLSYIINEKISDNISKNNVVSLDPGLKSFMTFNSLTGCGKIGTKYYNIIKQYHYRISKIDRLIKNKSFTKNISYYTTKINKIQKKIKLSNNKKKIKRLKNRMTKYEKYIESNNGKTEIKIKIKNIKALIKKRYMLFDKIKNITSELHHQTASYLCKNYDIILLPTFETQKMIKKNKESFITYKKNIEKMKNNNEYVEMIKYKKRKYLSKNDKQIMNSLSFYKFKSFIEHKAVQYGASVKMVTEEYTSLTCGYCGDQSNTYIKRIKTCSTCKNKIDRDYNGARNIMIKNLNQFVKTLIID